MNERADGHVGNTNMGYMICILLIVLGCLSIWFGALLADFSIVARNFTKIEKVLFFSVSVFWLFVGLKMFIAAWEEL